MEIDDKIVELFYERYSDIDSETIKKINNYIPFSELNNVIVGLNKHCYMGMLYSMEDPVEYRLYYFRGSGLLEGYCIRLYANDVYLKELTFVFSYLLVNTYKDLEVVDVFNTYQTKARGLLEKAGYTTINTESFEDSDFDFQLIAGNSRGFISVPLLDKGKFYRDFFDTDAAPEVIPGVLYVYLMLNKRSNLIKIGNSKKQYIRERTLQGQEPEVEKIAFWPAPHSVETELHKKYKAQRVRGEWFHLHTAQLREIKEFMSSYNY